MLWRKPTYFLFTIIYCFVSLPLVNAFVLPPDTANDSIKSLLKLAEKEIYNNTEIALSATFQAEKIAHQVNLDKPLFNVYRMRGYVLEQNSRLQEASNAYLSALNLQNSVNDSLKMDIFIDWAIINKKLKNYKTSQEYYTYALKIAEKQQDDQMISYSYNGLATLHGALGDFEKAIDYYHLAINAVEKKGKKKDLIAPYRNIALVYLKANNLTLALSNAEKSYNLALEVRDSQNIAGSLETLGSIYSANGQYQLALDKNFEALKIMEKGGDKRILLDILLQVADVHVQLNQLDKAEVFYRQCFKYKDLFEYQNHPTFYYKLGNLFIKQNKQEDARSAFIHSLSLATEGGFKDLIQKNNLALAQIYQKKGDFPNAYRCLETARVYADSLFNEEKARNITHAQFRFDVGRSEQKYKDLQLQQSRFWLIAAVVFFSVITILLTYFLRKHRDSNKALQNKNNEIKLQNRRLEESNEILRQFAYASAHDLKEPLRSISSFTSIIKRRYVALLPPEADEYMNFVTTGVKRMESLLSALLEYSTIIADSHEVSQFTPVHAVLEDVTKNLHLTVTEKNASINFPQAMCAVRMSRLHMTQLFQNLIANALKFTNRPPEINISCQLSKDNYTIKIQDNGIGMNPDYSDKIFRLFQRLNKSVEGTGIGLTICKNIVEKYNGKIWFESAEGVGTTFFISLPIELVHSPLQNTEGGQASSGALKKLVVPQS
ncbi:MAG: tetratricopeptide repeat protein [Saprospiraceae bacterium]|nr:tetratricopeptide repeat protein [Saprospiraceae bacterium]